MSKFINPFTDVGFKRIFGQEFSKPVLLAFLNGLLVGERKIVDLQYQTHQCAKQHGWEPLKPEEREDFMKMVAEFTNL